jgi:site-specific DNA-methyltransferase (adenine-specific)
MRLCTVYVGDCLRSLSALPGNSVHCCVTSPPYFGLRDYGETGQIGLEQTPEEYVAKLVAVFREVRRVLRDDGTLWVNLGDSYASVGGHTDQGANSARKNRRNVSAQNAQKYFAGGGDIKVKDLVGIPWMVAFALRADGWYLRQDIIWHKSNPMPESVTDRCTKAHEYIFLLSKSPRYYFDSAAIKEPSVTKDPRRPYTSQGAKDLDGREEWKSGQPREGADFSLRNRRDVWTVSTKPFKGSHFAVFPPDLIEPCILAGSPAGGIVLDPFGGSGTTAGVAVKHGRDALLCELNPEYAAMVKNRIKSISDAPFSVITL